MSRFRRLALVGALTGLVIMAGCVEPSDKSPSSSSAGGAPAELAISGTAPVPSAWRAGYEASWTYWPEHEASKLDPVGAYGAYYVDRDDDSVYFGSDVTTAAGVAMAAESSSGATKWLATTEEGCFGLVGESVACLGGRMGYYPTSLVDRATGEPSGSMMSDVKVAPEITEGRADMHGWGTFEIAGNLYASWNVSTNESSMERGIARISADGQRALWTSRYSGKGLPAFGAVVGRENHEIMTTETLAINSDTGDVIVSGSDRIRWAADNVLAGIDRAGVTAPDGAAIAFTAEPTVPILSQALPPYPLRMTESTVEAFEVGGSGAAAKWSFNRDAGFSSISAGYHDGKLLIVETLSAEGTGKATLVDAQTGTSQWSRALGPDVDLAMFFGAFAKDGTPIIQVDVSEGESSEPNGTLDSVVALDPNSGATLWVRTGALADLVIIDDWGVMSTQLEKYDSILINNFDMSFTMVSPGKSMAVPDVATAGCPDGWSPVSWTEYSEGSILLCQADSDYKVVIGGSYSDWQVAGLAFNLGGYDLVFTNGGTISVQAGGSLVTVTDGSSAMLGATNAWTSYGGAISTATAATGLTGCPSGSFPLSFATYRDGWVLVCGKTASSAATLVFSNGGKTTNFSDVQADGSGYCGSAGDARVCVYADPGIVTHQDGKAAGTSYPTNFDYFLGAGGSSTSAEEQAEDANAASMRQIEALAKSDGESIDMHKQWVAQLASKYLGVNDPLQQTVEGSHTFYAKDILAEHMALRYSTGAQQVVLLNSLTYGKKTGYNGKPIWVTVALDPSFDSEESVEAWCKNLYPKMSGEELRNSCFATRLKP